MRPLTAEDEATLRGIAARHEFYAARGPHTGEGSASRLIAALLAGEVVTLALTLAIPLPCPRRPAPSALRARAGPRVGHALSLSVVSLTSSTTSS